MTQHGFPVMLSLPPRGFTEGFEHRGAALPKVGDVIEVANTLDRQFVVEAKVTEIIGGDEIPIRASLLGEWNPAATTSV